MKKCVALLLALGCLCLSLVSCSSDNADKDVTPLEKTYSLGLAYEVCEDDSSKCVITGIGSCTDKNIVIPAYINGMRVCAIAEGAFSTKVQTVKGMKAGKGIPDATVAPLSVTPSVHTVQSLSETENNDKDAKDPADKEEPSYSFVGNSQETPSFSVVIDPTQPGLSFDYVIIDKGEGYVTGDGEPIALEDVESVRIPNTVTSIGEEAFYGCEELGTITAHRGICSVGQDAFLETAYYNDPKNWDGQALYLSTLLLSVSYSFSGEFTVREGTTTIADRAFGNCQQLTYVKMADSVSAVGNYAFMGCESLLYVDYSKVKTYTVGTGAYEGCISYQPYYVPFEGDAERYPTQFDAIEQTQFENVKEIRPSNYSCEQRNGGAFTFWWINGTIEAHYKSTVNGETKKDLYVVTDENGSAVYERIEDGLYATEEVLPTSMWIPEEVTYEKLTYNEENGSYLYEGEGEGALRLILGFVQGRLAYLCVTSEQSTVEVYYYDVDCTSLPNPPPIVRSVEGA